MDLFEQAVAAHKRNDFAAAERLYLDHLRRTPEDARALGLLGILYFDAGALERAVGALEASVALAPEDATNLANLGSALYELNRLDEAVERFARAVAIDPKAASAQYNLGLAFTRLGRNEEAAEALAAAAGLLPDDPEVQRDHGHALIRLRRHEEAVAAYDRALALDPNLDFVRGGQLHARMQIADWTNFAGELAAIEAGVADDRPVVEAFAFLALSTSRELQRQLARCMAARFSTKPPLPAARGAGRIRLGYFSSDFGDHPVSHFLVELIELHDRSQFEVFGFSLRRNPDSAFSRRIIGAFDRCIDVSAMTDQQAAAAAREAGIDIAIDLAGYTAGARTAIFAERAAPLQVAFLGYNGTMAADFIDYLVADSVAVPDSHRSGYFEKLILLPNYHVADRKREIAAVPGRAAFGLPEGAFVFCCFNQIYKILPEIFACWMRILHAVPGSVLWLASTNRSAIANLRREAKAAGIEPDRLIFAGPLPRPEYLARYALADLFLDTAPFNAVTTANDALWAGLPVLTLAGETFAGRMAASLLTSLVMPELITESLEGYEARAREIAIDRAQLARIKEKLRLNRHVSVLFNTERFADSLEAAFVGIVGRLREGLPPQDIRMKAT